MKMFQLCFDRFGLKPEYNIIPVEVVSFGRKYIRISGGHCATYNVKAKKYTGSLNGIISYPQIETQEKEGSLLFPELWMAQVIQSRLQMAGRAKKVIANLGIGNLSTAALQEIIRCEQYIEEDAIL